MAADKWGTRWISAARILSMVPPLILLRIVCAPDSVACALFILIGLVAAISLTGLYAEYSKICDAIEENQPGYLGNNEF